MGPTASTASSSDWRARLRAATPLLTALGTLAVLAGIVGARMLAEPIQPYGEHGAEYLEHLDRLRVVRAWWEIGLGAPGDLVRAWDQGFPFGLHLVGAPFGAVFGHSAKTVAWSGLLWLIPLALAVGSVVVSLDPWSGPAAEARVTRLAGIVGVLLLPAVHAAATRYHYDLPLTALIWVAAAVQLRWQDERPFRAGVAAGLLLFGAGLIKWGALPLGVPLLAACWLAPPRVTSKGTVRPRGNRRLVALVMAGLASGALLLGFLAVSDQSFSMMASGTFGEIGGAAEPEPLRFDEGLSVGIADAISRVGEALPGSPGDRLVAYLVHVVIGMLSPLLSVALLVCFVAWIGAGGPGMLMAAVALAGQLGFLVLGVPPMDERFLLPSLPWAAVIAVLGWRGFARGSRGRAAVVLVALALFVAHDLHHGDDPPWAFHKVWRETDTEFPHAQGRGIMLSSSFNQLGWSRRDDTLPARTAEREAVWQAVVDCGARDVLVAPGVITDKGTSIWWEYRRVLAFVEEGGEPPIPVALADPDTARVDLAWTVVVTNRGPLPEAPALTGQWEIAARVPEPGGSSETLIWRRAGRPLCGT